MWIGAFGDRYRIWPSISQAISGYPLVLLFLCYLLYVGGLCRTWKSSQMTLLFYSQWSCLVAGTNPGVKFGITLLQCLVMGISYTGINFVPKFCIIYCTLDDYNPWWLCCWLTKSLLCGATCTLCCMTAHLSSHLRFCNTYLVYV